MAMSGNAVKNVGNSGRIRVLINVTSQSVANNTSTVRVRGQMSKTNPSPAFNNNGVPMEIYGTNGITSRKSTTPFNISGNSWVTVRDETYTVSHDSSGRRTISASFKLGSTGTSSFGSGGTVTKSLTIDQIARVPNKPATPTISNVTHNSLRGNLGSAPANNGASIVEYGWQRQGASSGSGSTGTSRTWNVTGLSANNSYQVRVRARNSAGWGPWSNWSTSATTRYQNPAAPTNVNATYVNDSTAQITWTRNHTTAAPVQSQRVQRNRWVDGERTSWSTIDNISGTDTSYTDTTLTKHNDYRYRIQAINTSGTTSSAQSERVRTTPAAPTKVTASKVSGTNNIRVNFTQTMYPDEFTSNEIQDNPDGTGWVTVGTTTNPGTFTHTNADQFVNHQYQVRTLDSHPQGASNGDWSTPSNLVPAFLIPPEAPTLDFPANDYVPYDDPVVVQWTPNHPDTSTQEAATIRWTLNGASQPDINVLEETEYTLPGTFNIGDTITWTVSTVGAHPDASPYPPAVSIYLSSTPTVTITSPEPGQYTRIRFVVSWEAVTATGGDITAWVARLLDANNNVIEVLEGTDEVQAQFNYAPEDSEDYVIEVQVRERDYLWSNIDSVAVSTPGPTDFIEAPEILQEKGYSVVNEAISLDISNTTGGSDQISMQVNTHIDDYYLLGEAVRLKDYLGREHTGVVRGVSNVDGDLSVTADGLTALMNADKEFSAGATTLGEILESYVSMVYHLSDVTLLGDLADLPIMDYGGTQNLWERIRELCAAYKIDIVMVGNVITFQPANINTLDSKLFSQLGWSSDIANTARFIEVNYFEVEEQGVEQDQIEVYPFGDNEEASVIQVDRDEVVEVELEIDAWLSEVYQPECVEWVDNRDYSGSEGVYSVIGNDNLPIPPQQWLDAGGALEVQMTDDAETLLVIVTGADLEDLAPFRIAMSSGNHYNSLHITGYGQRFKRRTIQIATGSSTAVTGDDVGAVVESRWVTSKSLAYDVGFRVAKSYAGPNLRVEGVLQFSDTNPVASRINFKYHNFRIESVVTTPTGMSIGGSEATTMSDFDEYWATRFPDGMTFIDFNEEFGGLTFRDFAMTPLRRARE